MARKYSVAYPIASWTGFNIQIRDGIFVVQQSTIGYLHSIDSPATEKSTVFEILSKCLKIQEKLNLNAIVCVFYHGIYCKAAEIKWKYPEQFKNCILMLGIFHMLMMYLGISGKRFKDAGLKDVLIQSGVIAEGSVERALSGKMYNRSVRCLKIVYEALNRLLISQIEDVDEFGGRITIDEMQEKIQTFFTDINEESFQELSDHDVTKKYINTGNSVSKNTRM